MGGLEWVNTFHFYTDTAHGNFIKYKTVEDYEGSIFGEMTKFRILISTIFWEA